MTHLSTPLFYYDDYGYKIGPIDKKELYAFAENGIIKPETRITDDNIEVKAKSLPKLKFGSPEFKRTKELEERFNPENIDYNSLPPIPPPTAPKPIIMEIPIQQTQPQTTNPVQQIITNIVTNRNFSPQSQPNNYIFFPIILYISHAVAIITLIIGSGLTILFTLGGFVNPLFFLFALGTLYITLLIIFSYGFLCDFIKWLLNVEKFLTQKENRLDHND